MRAVLAGFLAASLIAGCSSSSPTAELTSASAPPANNAPATAAPAATVAPTVAATAPGAPTPSPTPMQIPVLDPAAICASVSFKDCLESFRYVSSKIPGRLVAVCEFESSSGAILEIDRPEEASDVCPPEGTTDGRIVAVGLMPSP